MEKAAAKLESGDDDDGDESGGTSATELPKHPHPDDPRRDAEVERAAKHTDPESRIMIRNGTFLRAYDAQAAVS